MIDSSFCPSSSADFCTLLWSVTPFLELRASIPLGILEFGLSPLRAVSVSILGGIITAALILWILPYCVTFFERHIPLFDRIMQKIFAKTRAEHSHKMAVIGESFLVLFVAIPLPGSGAWSGVLISYLFGIPYKKALLLVSTGVLISGILVAILTLFGNKIWNHFT